MMIRRRRRRRIWLNYSFALFEFKKCLLSFSYDGDMKDYEGLERLESMHVASMKCPFTPELLLPFDDDSHGIRIQVQVCLWWCTFTIHCDNIIISVFLAHCRPYVTHQRVVHTKSEEKR